MRDRLLGRCRSVASSLCPCFPHPFWSSLGYCVPPNDRRGSLLKDAVITERGMPLRQACVIWLSWVGWSLSRFIYKWHLQHRSVCLCHRPIETFCFRPRSHVLSHFYSKPCIIDAISLLYFLNTFFIIVPFSKNSRHIPFCFLNM